MNQKFKAKAADSFKTKLDLYLFCRVSEDKTNQVNHEDFNKFEIDQKLIDQYTTEYWQEFKDYPIGKKTVVKIEIEIAKWKSGNKTLIEELKQYYVSHTFPTVFPLHKFEKLLKDDQCAYCGITTSQIEKLGENHNLRKKNLRGWVLEIDRLDSNKEYKPDNTVMACYWCNNAKTDEFTKEEFDLIGSSIKRVWESRLSDRKLPPDYFCFNKSNVKAIVLGADPTNYSDHGKQVNLNYAFGIGQDSRYFNGIMENLKLLGLHLEDLYIDNLKAGYQKHETNKNKEFVQSARQIVTELCQRLSTIKHRKNIPVFITAQEVYKALLKKEEKCYSAQALYNLEAEIPIPADKNLLNRPLIPLFRHDSYSNKNQERYFNYLKSYFKKQQAFPKSNPYHFQN